MVQTAANPSGLPKSVFDGFQAQVAANRSIFDRDVASGPFYGFTGRGSSLGSDHPELVATVDTGVARAHYDGIVAFSQTDLTVAREPGLARARERG